MKRHMGEQVAAGFAAENGLDFESTWRALGLEGAAVAFARQVWAAAVQSERLAQAAPPPLFDHYVAWLRVVQGEEEFETALELCGSNDEGAFRVYREPAPGQEFINRALREIVNRIERCGASPELTHAVTLASDLQRAVGDKYNPADPYAVDLVRAQLVVAEAKAMTDTFPRVLGTGRMGDNPKAVLLALEREPTDDELRAIHDALASGSSRVVPSRTGEGEALLRHIHSVMLGVIHHCQPKPQQAYDDPTEYHGGIALAELQTCANDLAAALAQARPAPEKGLEGLHLHTTILYDEGPTQVPCKICDWPVAPAPKVDDDKAKAFRGEVGSSSDSHLGVGGKS